MSGGETGLVDVGDHHTYWFRGNGERDLGKPAGAPQQSNVLVSKEVSFFKHLDDNEMISFSDDAFIVPTEAETRVSPSVQVYIFFPVPTETSLSQ